MPTFNSLPTGSRVEQVAKGGLAVFLSLGAVVLTGCSSSGDSDRVNPDPIETVAPETAAPQQPEATTPSDGTGPKTVAYLPTWLSEEGRQGTYAELLQLPEDSYDTVIVSFAEPNAEGGLNVPEMSQDALEVVNKLGKEKGLAVGGYGEDDIEHEAMNSYWAKVLENPETMVRGIVDVVKQNEYSSVDIDYEYPTAEQKVQFTAFIAALRNALPANIAITLAIPAFDGSRVGYDFPALNEFIGEGGYHLMSYDYSGSWSPKAGDVANAGDVAYNLDAAIAEIGDPKKVSLGFDSICRVFKGAKARGDNYSGQTEDIGFAELVQSGVEIVDDAKLASSSANFKGSWTSCTSPNVVREVIARALQQNEQLGGFFVWHAGGADAEFAQALDSAK
mgnify:CR=1 FL=1